MTWRIFSVRYAMFRQQLGKGDLYEVIDQNAVSYGEPQPKEEAVKSCARLQSQEDAQALEDAAVIGMLGGFSI